MAETCPTCGAEVRPRSADEGTIHFEVMAERRLRALQEGVARELASSHSGWADRLREILVASGCPVFQVEVEHPYEPDDRRDERYECVGIFNAGCRWEDLTGEDSEDAEERLAGGEDLEFEDEETGRIVTARPKES